MCCHVCPTPHLYPLFPVDLHTVGPQRGDGSVYDLLHHLSVAVGLLQLGGGDPDVTVSGDVLASLVQDATGVLVGLQAGQGQPQLGRGETREDLRAHSVTSQACVCVFACFMYNSCLG